MKNQKSSDAKRGSWTKERVETIGYFCWGVGIICLLMLLAPFLDNQSRIYLSSVGLAIFGIGIGFIGLSVAHKSGKLIEAMANLEFYEKIAVIENYIAFIKAKQNVNVIVEAIYNDIKGAKQLKKYVNPEIEQKLDNKIQALIDIALKDHPYGDLVKRLQEIQNED